MRSTRPVPATRARAPATTPRPALPGRGRCGWQQAARGLFARQAWASNPQAKLLAGEWGEEECATESFHQPSEGGEAETLAKAMARLESMCGSAQYRHN